MALHLVTGYAGEAHITSADQGAYNIATYGGGEFVLDRGNKFVTTLVSNNSITIADGEAMMQGRYTRMTPGTSEDVTIDNGSSGMKRNDLICLRYEKDPSTGVESVGFSVVKGEETSGTPVDPEYTHGDITDGDDLVNEMPLYRVYLNGLNVETITPLFSVYVSMKDYMDEYQLPIASANRLGGIKVGNYLNIGDDGTLSPKLAGNNINGVVQIPKRQTDVTYLSNNSTKIIANNYSNGELNIAEASSNQYGVLATGRGFREYNGLKEVTLVHTSVYMRSSAEITIQAGTKRSEVQFISSDETLTKYARNGLAIPAGIYMINSYLIGIINQMFYDDNKVKAYVDIFNYSNGNVTLSSLSNSLVLHYYYIPTDYYRYDS